jgi:hypothetical protein
LSERANRYKLDPDPADPGGEVRVGELGFGMSHFSVSLAV